MDGADPISRVSGAVTIVPKIDLATESLTDEALLEGESVESLHARWASFTRPGDVILFHDNHPYIGRVLDGVLPGLRNRGLLPSDG